LEGEMAERNGQIGALEANVETLIDEVKGVRQDVKDLAGKVITACERSVAHSEQIKSLFTNQEGFTRWLAKLDARMWGVVVVVVLAVVGGAVKLVWM